MPRVGRCRSGAVLLVGALLASSACSSHEAPTTSVLSGGARTCAAAGAECARSGAVRWVLPLAGTYDLDVVKRISPAVYRQRGGDGLSVVSSGETVYLQSGGRVLAVDSATGRVRWRRVDRGAVSSDPLHLSAGRLLLVQRFVDRSGTRVLSLDPRTGASRVIPLRTGEAELDTSTGGLLLAAAVDDTSSEVRRVDPVSGRTTWRVSLGSASSYATHGHVLYMDDNRQRDDLGPKASDRYQTRRIRRVDLRSGRRLPDVAVPRKLWSDASLGYVTRAGVIVLFGRGSGKDRAFTPDGRVVEPLPDNDEVATTRHETRARVVGSAGGVQHLVGHGWTGPAMRATADPTVGVTEARPHVAYAVACAPDAVRPGDFEDPFPGNFCDKPRFVAITW